MIIAIKPPTKVSEKIAVQGGLTPETLHFTLFYLGTTDTISQDKYVEYVKIIKEVCSRTAPFPISLTSKSRFEKVRMATDPEGNMVEVDKPTDVIMLEGSGSELFQFRQYLAEVLDNNDLYYSKLHKEFQPHVSLIYVPHGEDLNLSFNLPIEWMCSEVEIWGDGNNFRQTFTLYGEER